MYHCTIDATTPAFVLYRCILCTIIHRVYPAPYTAPARPGGTQLFSGHLQRKIVSALTLWAHKKLKHTLHTVAGPPHSYEGHVHSVSMIPCLNRRRIFTPHVATALKGYRSTSNPKSSDFYLQFCTELNNSTIIIILCKIQQ